MRSVATKALASASFAALFALAGAAHAADSATDAARFGALPFVSEMFMSPDGSKFAFTSHDATGHAMLAVIDTKGDSQIHGILALPEPNQDIAGCGFATDTRIVCSMYMRNVVAGDINTAQRPFAIDADGKNLRQLGNSQQYGYSYYIATRSGGVIDWNGAKPGSVLMNHAFTPEVETGSIKGRSAAGVGVISVDVDSGAQSTVEQPRGSADGYMTDGHGNVRIMGLSSQRDSGMQTGRGTYLYRLSGARGWQPLSTVQEQDNRTVGFTPEAIDHDKNLVYGTDRDSDGFLKLYTIALDGSNRREMAFAAPGVDVDGPVTLGRDNRVVGVRYTTDSPITEYFDPELAKLRDGLGKALPGDPAIGFIDTDAGEHKLLVFASSDTQPGQYYVYDKASHALSPIVEMRGQLKGIKLAEMRPITFPASDGTMIPGYLSLPPGSDGKGLPAIVMPHGGPSARDDWGFDWLVQFFTARGYAVLQPNYRGSSGYGEAFYLHNGFKSWRTAIGDVDDAGRWLLKQGIAAPGKLAIVGWSYGGYAALQSQVLDPDLYKAVVAIAPVTDLGRLLDESRESSDFEIVQEAIGTGPAAEEGSPARHAAQFHAPVLLFHGDEDQNVRVEESRLMNSRLQAAGKSVQYVEFPGLDHQLFDTAARTRMLSTSDQFLRKALGIQ